MPKSMSFIRIASIVFLIAFYPVAGHASMFGANGLDPKFCATPTVRQTVVYIDDTMMQPGNTTWVSDLENKLQATLTPGERLTIVRLSPLSGTTQELWSACWPDYSSAEKAKLAAGTYLFTSNPLADLKNQQAIFTDEFLGAITKIYNASKGSPNEAVVNATNPPTKQIIAALSSDSARYTDSEITNRLIVYTDLAENSDLGSAFKPLQQPFPDIGEKLGLEFHNSIFYFFGVGADVSQATDFLQNATAFWRAALQTTGGAVGGIGSNLSIINSIPVSAVTDKIELIRNNQHLSGALSLLVDSDGNLIDSWLSITRLSVSGISGTFVCETTNCSLHAKTDAGITILNVNENVDLSGPSPSSLAGTIGVPGSLTFPLTAFAQAN